ncbi:enoyl-CoA hydratase/isomerase family protein [Paraburkholderia sp. CI3]|uniref:enoyl-CoA hydratase/isomerase family protein n=1 Tax=Paraburkholderia sp. CI3 TaxID=2991060 RepID=UPI003D1A3D88
MKALTIDRTPASWTVVLDRPQAANALSGALIEELIEAVAEAEDAGTRVLAFRGAGRNFSAGFDLGDLEAQSDGDLLQRLVRIETLLQSIAHSTCLTVAFGHGHNFGAGVDLFAACRWRVADDTATFRMPGLVFGLALGTRRFASIVGTDNARDILEGLRTFSAAQGRDLGFVRSVVSQDDWACVLDEAKATAGSLPQESRKRLYEALDGGSRDEDMARLVRSAAVPGLKQRLRSYLAAQQEQRTPKGTR